MTTTTHDDDFSPRPRRASAREDRLPPHALEAEQGILGCCLLDPAACVPKVLQQFGTDPVFYEPRHEIVWHALTSLHHDGKGIDLITVNQHLKDIHKVDDVGGILYLQELMGVTPSAANLDYYIPTVWEKYLARRLVRLSTEAVCNTYNRGGLAEGDLAAFDREVEDFRRLQDRHQPITPRHLKRPYDFAEEFYAFLYQGALDQAPGLDLPFPFVWRLRPGETTMFVGENGTGKSTLLSHFNIKWGLQGSICCVASMEMRKEVTLGIMCRQLLGRKKFSMDNPADVADVKRAFDWLQRHVIIYDFIGIAHWRELLDTFHYARTQMGATVFTVDSIMKLGIPGDDYSQQTAAAHAFSTGFAMATGAHVVLVNHTTKGEGRVRDKASGSKMWSNNCDNILSITRDIDKATKVADYQREYQYGGMEAPEYDRLMKEIAHKPDSKLHLDKQRYPGTEQNGSVGLWFHPDSLQFVKKSDLPSVNYLAK